MATWKYCLDDELEHWVAEESAPRFSNRWLTIEPGADGTRIRVSAGYAWDGCTGAPDLPGTRQASCLHDAVYQFAEAISAAWRMAAECIVKVLHGERPPGALNRPWSPEGRQ